MSSVAAKPRTAFDILWKKIGDLLHEDTKDSTGSDDVQLTGDGEEGIGTVQNVGSSQITLDPNLQYQLRTDTGQVTYRVVQVTGDGTESAQVWPQMPSSQELRQ